MDFVYKNLNLMYIERTHHCASPQHYPVCTCLHAFSTASNSLPGVFWSKMSNVLHAHVGITILQVLSFIIQTANITLPIC